ncbi:hypothetical protein [Arthrobacter gengyunqii]|uniref:Uncharacterized protein n=1 Tax=Arthrobacter gengyunqii TaxID=2886940 RepID=A0ABS8GIT6_9MICC|nr:hypothetical protein [Arthrobacter gengyunqii]MCC3265892.1 hypothetical protein [Arthrobacter gengyunqii]
MIGQCGDGNAAIDLLSFEGQFPATDALREHAVTLKYAARNVQENAEEISVTWSSLQNPGIYAAPGQDLVYSAMVPVTNAASWLHEAVQEAVTALNNYADEAAEIKTRYRDGAKIQAQEFLQEIASDPEWNRERRLTEKQDNILDALSGLTMELEASQRNCANALGRIWGGETYGAMNENGETAPGQTAHGFTNGAYEALGEANLLAWGNNAEWNYTGLKQGGMAQGMLMGFGDGVEDTVEFAGSMAFLRGIDNGKAAWRGLFELGVLGAYAVQPNWKGDAARGKFKEIGKDALGLDMWETDPARAGGRNIFDIVTIVVPGGIVAKVIKIGHVKSGKQGNGADGKATNDQATDTPDLTGAGRTRAGRQVVPELAGIPREFFETKKSPVWESVMPSADSGSPSPVSSGDRQPTGPPEFGVRIPDQRDPRPGYVGRDPGQQPQVGETGVGGGSWEIEYAQGKGGPYQEFITGVKGPDGKWLEYVLPVDKTDLTPSGQVKFDGYFTEPGPPPAYVFQEAKGSYAWMANIPGRLRSQLLDWFSGEHAQFQKQALAIESIPNARLEWNFSDKNMKDAFLEAARNNSLAMELLEDGKLVVNWVPMPGKEIG